MRITKEEYLEMKGCNCPYCLSVKVIPDIPKFVGKQPDMISVMCNCFDCNSRWEEFYKLESMREITRK